MILKFYVHGDKRRDSFNQNFRAELRKCLLGKGIEVPKGLVPFHFQEEIRSCKNADVGSLLLGLN